MSDHRPSDERITQALRRKRLTFAQRRKHLDRLEQALAAGEDEMEFLRRRGRVEFGVLAAAVMLLLLGIVVWTTVLDDSGAADDAADLLAIAEVTLTAQEPLGAPTATGTQAVVPAPSFASGSSACPVDPLATELLSVLPLEYPSHRDWYGDPAGALWASPANLQTWFPLSAADAAGLWFAGRPTSIMWYGVSLPIEVRARQLDGDTSIETVTTTSEPFNLVQFTAFTIPEPGCWEISGVAGAASLTMTVEVLPYDARPDMAMIRDFYEARPYEAPDTCPISPWAGPDVRGNSNFAHYWLEANGLSAEVPGLFVAGDQQSMGIYGDGVTEALAVVARALEQRTEEVVASTSIWNSNARLASFVFPEPGCWELTLTSPVETATFVLYVYPEDCKPVWRDDAYRVECAAPQP